MENLEYLKKFWVGLMDGDGSIQVNHWRKKNLQFRLVIKLKNCVSNIKMLKNIQKAVGGYITITKPTKKNKDVFVLWIVNDKLEIKKIIKIFDLYPLLTKRKQAQLIFLKQNLEKNDINWYLQERNNKYLIVDSLFISYDIFYFNEWFSGFVEAAGCFTIRKNNRYSFSVSQKYEKSLFIYIQKYFNITTKLREIHNNIFIIEVYKKSVINDLIIHFTKYPLLGEKNDSFNLFKVNF